MNSKTRSLPQEFCRRDPLFALLRERLELEPGQVALITAFITCIALSVELYLACLPFAQASLLVSFQALVIYPLAVILYFAVPEFLAKPFSKLEQAGVIGSPSKKSGNAYSAFRERMITSMNNRFWMGAAGIMIGYYRYYRLFGNVPSDPSQVLPVEIRVWFRVLLLVMYTPLLFMGVLTLGRILTGLVFTSRFFHSFKIKINPLNPDGAGRIGFLGQMLVISALIATAFGAAATGLVYVNLAAGNDPLSRVEIILLGLIYVILIPLLFHSLLWSPHQSLLRAREEALEPLAREYERASGIPLPATRKNANAIKSKTDHLVEIKRQYELIRDSFPVWTLDTTSLRNLLATRFFRRSQPCSQGLCLACGNLWLKFCVSNHNRLAGSK